MSLFKIWSIQNLMQKYFLLCMYTFLLVPSICQFGDFAELKLELIYFVTALKKFLKKQTSFYICDLTDYWIQEKSVRFSYNIKLTDGVIHYRICVDLAKVSDESDLKLQPPSWKVWNCLNNSWMNYLFKKPIKEKSFIEVTWNDSERCKYSHSTSIFFKFSMSIECVNIWHLNEVSNASI